MKQALEELLTAAHSRDALAGTVSSCTKIKGYYVLGVWYDGMEVCIPVKSNAAWWLIAHEIDFIPIFVNVSSRIAIAEAPQSVQELLHSMEDKLLLSEQVVPV